MIRRYEALDGLRGVCALGVVLYHFDATGILCQLAPIRGGQMFVDFFFVLSGFVIAASYGDRLRDGFSIKRFMLLRWGRVYPLHFVVLMVFALMECVALFKPGLAPRPAFTGKNSVESLISNIFMLQSTGIDGHPSWNTPSWSISAEVWTYLLMALLLRYAGRAFWLLLAVLVAGCGVMLAGTQDHLLHSWEMGIPRCIYGFGMGMAAFALLRARGRVVQMLLQPRLANGVELVVVALALVLLSLAGKGMWTMVAPPLFFVLVIVLAEEQGLISRFLLTRPMRFLGTLSYSIYIGHVFVMGRVLDVVGMVSRRLGHPLVQYDGIGNKTIVASWPVADGLTIVTLLLAIMMGWITYRFVEVPAREWSRRLAAKFWQPAPSLA